MPIDGQPAPLGEIFARLDRVAMTAQDLVQRADLDVEQVIENAHDSTHLYKVNDSLERIHDSREELEEAIRALQDLSKEELRAYFREVDSLTTTLPCAWNGDVYSSSSEPLARLGYDIATPFRILEAFLPEQHFDENALERCGRLVLENLPTRDHTDVGMIRAMAEREFDFLLVELESQTSAIAAATGEAGGNGQKLRPPPKAPYLTQKAKRPRWYDLFAAAGICTGDIKNFARDVGPKLTAFPLSQDGKFPSKHYLQFDMDQLQEAGVEVPRDLRPA